MKKITKKNMIKFGTMAGAVLLVCGMMVLGANKNSAKASSYEPKGESYSEVVSEDEFDYEAFYEELNWEDEEECEDEDEVKTIVSEGEYGIKTVHKWYKNKVEKIVYDKDGNVILRDVYEYLQ